MYTTKIKFDKRAFEVSIFPKGGGKYDLEIETKGSLCGDDYMRLKKYLEEEGYIDAAQEWLKA
jgi:hypothetical protein